MLTELKKINKIYENLTDYNIRYLFNKLLINFNHDKYINDDLTIKKIDKEEVLNYIIELCSEKKENQNNQKDGIDFIINQLKDLKEVVKNINYDINVNSSESDFIYLYQNMSYLINTDFLVFLDSEKFLKSYIDVIKLSVSTNMYYNNKIKLFNNSNPDNFIFNFLKLKIQEDIHLDLLKNNNYNIEFEYKIKNEDDILNIKAKDIRNYIKYYKDNTLIGDYLVKEMNNLLSLNKDVELNRYINISSDLLKRLVFNEKTYNMLYKSEKESLILVYKDKLTDEQKINLAMKNLNMVLDQGFDDLIKNKDFLNKYLEKNTRIFFNINEYFSDVIKKLDVNNEDDFNLIKKLTTSISKPLENEHIPLNFFANKEIINIIIEKGVSVSSKKIKELKKINPEIQKIDNFKNLLTSIESILDVNFNTLNMVYAEELNKPENYQMYKECLKKYKENFCYYIHIPKYVIEDLSKVNELISITKNKDLISFFNKIYDKNLLYIKNLTENSDISLEFYPDNVKYFINAITPAKATKEEKLISLSAIVEKKLLERKTIGSKIKTNISFKSVYSTLNNFKHINNEVTTYNVEPLKLAEPDVNVNRKKMRI